MSLNPKQIEQFKTQGYVIVPNFFNARQVQAMQAEVERFKRDGLFNNVATDGDGKTKSTAKRNLQICPTIHVSSFFRALPFDEKVVSAVSSLIGDPFMLHLDQIFLKPAGDGAGTNWHQDNSYFKISDPLKGTAMWIAVHDANLANGTLRVIPNSFREELKHERDPMSNHHIRCWPDESKAVPCEIKAGGVAFFCYGTPHATGGNATTKDRAGMAYHFLHVDVAAASAWGDKITKPDRQYNPVMSGAEATGGAKEYGVKVAGTFADEVNKTLTAALAHA